jgi:murein DD-endopeptidase MepM/ murein hydrolase activator NlpD
MVVPEGLGTTRTLHLRSAHFWATAGIFTTLVLMAGALAFSLSYLYGIHAQTRDDLLDLQRANKTLSEKAATVAAALDEERTTEEQNALEERLRREYETSMRAIVAELHELRDEEAMLREVHKLPPRTAAPGDYVQLDLADVGDGQGGPPGALGDELALNDDGRFRPPDVIYGLATPSADLILQEIRLRRQSMAELRQDTLAWLDKVERKPTGWPVTSRKRRITSRFGWRRDPFNRSVVRHHDGTDIAAPYGTPVRATALGRVIASEYDGAYGHVVRIDHGDGFKTVYAHLSERLCKVGDRVERGDVIGKLGSSGRSTGPHLHYEVFENGDVTDAERFLR